MPSFTIAERRQRSSQDSRPAGFAAALSPARLRPNRANQAAVVSAESAKAPYAPPEHRRENQEPLGTLRVRGGGNTPQYTDRRKKPNLKRGGTNRALM